MLESIAVDVDAAVCTKCRAADDGFGFGFEAAFESRRRRPSDRIRAVSVLGRLLSGIDGVVQRFVQAQ